MASVDRPSTVVGDDPVRLELEEFLLPPGRIPEQQLEGAVGHLEVVPLVLQPLEGVEYRGHGLGVELESQLGGLHGQGRPTGHLGDHEAGPVPDQFRRDVLVGIRAAGDGGGVEPGLVGEDRRTDEGLLRVGGDVDQLGDVMGHRGEQLQPLPTGWCHPQLQGEVRDGRRQVRIAGPFAVAVDAPLDVGGTLPHRSQRVGHGTAAVIVEVDTDLRLETTQHARRRSARPRRAGFPRWCRTAPGSRPRSLRRPGGSAG